MHRIYFEWELAIPLVPAMAWVYFSIVPLMLSPLLCLDIPQLSRLAQRLALAMLLAGAIFVAFPGTIGYPPATDPPGAIEFIRTIDRPYNVLPSLHVALSSLIVLHLAPRFGTRGRLFLAAWLAALVVSVILTHQHHLADVFAAGLLVWLCVRIVPGERPA